MGHTANYPEACPAGLGQQIGKVALHEISRQSRSVAFGVAGDPAGAPALLFYPAGGNRRMLQGVDAVARAASLNLICVNRPGKQGTSPAPGEGHAAHAVAVCEDAVAVLDHLGIQKASLLFMCAGTPFALLFAACFRARCTGRLVGLASWVSPADFDGASSLYKLGAALPSWFVAPLVGTSFASAPKIARSLPQSSLVGVIQSDFSVPEKAAFGERFPEPDDFAKSWRWQTEEAGGQVEDMAVLLSSFSSLGAEYSQVFGEITFVHGENDKLSPIAGVEWLAGQLPGPTTLKRAPLGTHEGVLLLLHDDVQEAFHRLHHGEQVSTADEGESHLPSVFA